jgi:excisionase family DNA binding protein
MKREQTPVAAEDSEALMTVDDLSAMLRIPKSTVYAWSYRRVGPPGIRVGRHLRFRRGDVIEWLRGQEAGR